MNVSAQELKLRIQVVQLALTLYIRKEHYFYGAPDTGRLRMLPDDFSDDPIRCHILAAGDGRTLCAGRCDAADVAHRARFEMFIKESGLTRRAKPVDIWMLAQPTSFPRYYEDGDKANPSPKGPVWGESCAGKMHFDCGSFVRYCFRTILGPTLVRPGIQMHDFAQSVWSSDSGKKLADVDVLPADIVYVDKEHVGLATGSAEYVRQAQDSGLLPRPTPSAGSAAGAFKEGETVHAWFARMGIAKTSLASPTRGQPKWTEIRRWQKWVETPAASSTAAPASSSRR